MPYRAEPRNVRPVGKDAKFRPLNDEEKQLQLIRGKKRKNDKSSHPHGLFQDAQGNTHFDDFV